MATGIQREIPLENSRWTQAQALADRLVEERRKLNGLVGEVEKLQFICEDLRDLQLYPVRVTGFAPQDDLEMDKAIEKLEVATAKTKQFVLSLEPPLADAVFITREMAGEELNRDMLELLSGDNTRRVSRLIEAQQEIDSRWKQGTELVIRYRKKSFPGTDFEAVSEDGNRPDGFLAVLQSGVGLSSNHFYEIFHAYKDSLAARGGDGEWNAMAGIDLERLRNRLSGKSLERVRRDLERLRLRFEHKMPIGLIQFTLASASLASGRPAPAAEYFAAISPESKMFEASRLGLLQAYFAAKEDDSVAANYFKYAGNPLVREGLESARYLAVQSLYAMNRDSLVEQVSLQSKASGPWNSKIMLIYARSLVKMERHAEARVVLAKVAGDPANQQDIRNQASLLLAHLNFEDRFHEKALQGYRNLLNQEGMQAEALYGMVWCNIRLGDLDAAEFILKKLISQYPDDPWAMEGFMVLVRKMLNKAREEWSWHDQYYRQLDRLQQISSKVNQGETPMSPEEKAGLNDRIDSARAILSRQVPAPPQKIAGLYQQALTLCDFIESRYRSGEFSERKFRTDREKVLKTLRSVEKGVEIDSASPPQPEKDNRKIILEKLFESRAMALDIHILHRSWLSEVLKFWQIGLRKEMDALGNDSASQARKKDLEKQARFLADEIGEKVAAKSEDILQRIASLSEAPNTVSIQDWLLFQSGYLRYLREEDALRRTLASRRLIRSLGDPSGPSSEEEPEVDYRSYEEPWLDLLRRYPESQWAPAALYYLGYSMAARGENDRSLIYFRELADNHPQSTYTQQALIFIGESYFNENNLAAAEAAYDKVLDFPDSRYFDQALYKLAWTRYRMNAYKSAISSFSFILEESLRKNGGKQGILAGEALQYTALSLAEADTSGEGGWKEGVDFADRFGNPRVGSELLHKMALIYLQQGRLDRARRALESLLKTYPGYSKAPEVIMDLAQAFDKGQDFEQGAVLRERVLRSYQPGSEAYQAVSDKNRRIELDTLVQNACAMAARHHLLEARKIPAGATGVEGENKARHYRKALALLELWRKAYPMDPRGVKNLYQQAEILFSLGEYGGAARKYIEVSRKGDGPLRMTAAYNAIVSAQELKKRSEGEVEP